VIFGLKDYKDVVFKRRDSAKYLSSLSREYPFDNPNLTLLEILKKKEHQH